jgi:NADPH:quinone reductase-like Zn-dependent oxidoreductase
MPVMDDQTPQIDLVGPGEVLVHLRATSYLPAEGNHDQIAVGGAGTIEACGEAVQDYKTGRDVLVYLYDAKPIRSDRIPVHVDRLCRMPPSMDYDDASSMPFPFVVALSVLRHHLGISNTFEASRTRIPSISTALILGGERNEANALIQLLRIGLPSCALFVAVRKEDKNPPEPFQDAVRPFAAQAIALGAKYAIDASASDLVEHLHEAVDEYTPSKKFDLAFDFGDETKRRPEIAELLSQGGKVLDCSRTEIEISMPEDVRREAMQELDKILCEGKLQPPMCKFDVNDFVGLSCVRQTETKE